MPDPMKAPLDEGALEAAALPLADYRSLAAAFPNRAVSLPGKRLGEIIRRLDLAESRLAALPAPPGDLVGALRGLLRRWYSGDLTDRPALMEETHAALSTPEAKREVSERSRLLREAANELDLHHADFRRIREWCRSGTDADVAIDHIRAIVEDAALASAERPREDER